MRNPTVVSLSFPLVLGVIACLVGDRGARADIPPPDSCTAPGQPCNNAGPAFNQAGTCTPSTCTRTVPGPDGGSMTMSYACNLCKVGGAGGAGGAGGETGTGGSTGTGGETGTGGTTGTGGRGTDAGTDADGGKTSSSKGSGCAIAATVAEGWLGGPLVVIGLFGFLHARRRRRP